MIVRYDKASLRESSSTGFGDDELSQYRQLRISYIDEPAKALRLCPEYVKLIIVQFMGSFSLSMPSYWHYVFQMMYYYDETDKLRERIAEDREKLAPAVIPPSMMPRFQKHMATRAYSFRTTSRFETSPVLLPHLWPLFFKVNLYRAEVMMRVLRQFSEEGEGVTHTKLGRFGKLRLGKEN